MLLKQAPESNSILIKWSNDDDARESGEFFVSAEKDLTLTQYLRHLSGPFGGGEVVNVSTEVYQLGEQSFSCWFVERFAESESGSHATSLWLSAEVPAARIVAYRSRWQAAAEQADRAPPTVLEVELSAYGNQQGAMWQRQSVFR